MAKKGKYYVRPDGIHETIRKINGKRVAFRGRTDAEVDRKMLEYREELSRGRMVPEIAKEWYAAKCGEVRESSGDVYRAAVGRFVEFFSGTRAGEVRPMDCNRFIRDIERRGYAGSTVNVQITVMKQIFAHAVLQGDIEVSPATEVKRSRGLPKTERRPLTEEEEGKVLAYRGKDWELGVILLYTGMRRGELLALDWQDIDRKAGVIHVHKKLNLRRNPPKLEHFLKNAQKRDAPLFQVLADILPRNRVGKVIADENGDYLTLARYERRWADYREAVGLGEEATAHCFRHSYATLCYEAGIDEKAAAAFLGDTEGITRAVYQKLRDRHHRSSAEKVNAYLELRAGEKREEQA